MEVNEEDTPMPHAENAPSQPKPHHWGTISMCCGILTWIYPLGTIAIVNNHALPHRSYFSFWEFLIFCVSIPVFPLLAIVTGNTARRWKVVTATTKREERRAGAGLRMAYAFLIMFGMLIFLSIFFWVPNA